MKASISPSIFPLSDDNLSVNGFSPHLVCALILSRSGFGLLNNGQVSSIFDSLLSACHVYVFSFPEDNFQSKYQCFHQTWYVHLYCGG